MKQKTEFINNKKIDHFDKWSKQEAKAKITFNMSISDGKKSSGRKKFLNIVETEAVKIRRLELNASKEEIANGQVAQDYKLKLENDLLVKSSDRSRQAELMHAKDFLKEAVGTNRRSFVFAS